MNNQQGNGNGNTASDGDTPSPLSGTGMTHASILQGTSQSSRLNYAALLQRQAALAAHYTSIAATAASAVQHQQLHAKTQQAQEISAAVTPTGRILAAGKPAVAIQQEQHSIGGAPIPAMKVGTPTKIRVEAAAQFAAEAAVPYHEQYQAKKKRKVTVMSATAAQTSLPSSVPPTSMGDFPEQTSSPTKQQSNIGKQPPPSSANATTASNSLIQKQQTNRDRNREHARSTRLRKKAYVNKLKELLDALHVERSEDDRQRRVAVQKLAEIQDLRRKVVKTFFGYHANCETNVAKWRVILDEDFWLKQPVTPYRSFRRCEIEKGSRITKGVEGMAGDAASMSVMIETMGSRNLRWLRRKRDYFLARNNATTKLDRVGRIRTNAANAAAAAAAAGGSGGSGSRTSMPHSIVREDSRLQHAISSLSSSSESGHGSSGEDVRKVESMGRRNKQQTSSKHRSTVVAKKVSCSGSSNQLSSSSNDTRQQSQEQQQQQLQQQGQSNDYHDYHAPSLLDPLPEPGDSVASDDCVVGKHMLTTDNSSEDDEDNISTPRAKKQKLPAGEAGTPSSSGQNKVPTPTAAAVADANRSAASLPPNVAHSGISHTVSVNVLPSSASLPNGHAQLVRAPATALPPFIGIGKKSSVRSGTGSSPSENDEAGFPSSGSSVEPTNNESTASTAPTAVAVASHDANHSSGELGGINPIRRRFNYLHPQRNSIAIDNDTTSSSSLMEKLVSIKAYYHLNEDDMILTDDVLMCPFIFRSQDAVLCGALSECVMPGMLRACFSPTNKLSSMEMIFDAMGFCQQLERASGNDSMAQIIPNSLEMALSPLSDDARVITLSKAPYPIVSVNEAWTRVTGYTQVDVEGKDLSILNGRETKEMASDMESVSKGHCACSVNVHYDVNGRDFFSFVCSYPLTNLNDEVTHLLHVFQELPARE